MLSYSKLIWSSKHSKFSGLVSLVPHFCLCVRVASNSLVRPMLKKQPLSWTLWCLVKTESTKKHTLAFTISTQMCPTSLFEMLLTYLLLRKGFLPQGNGNSRIFDTWQWTDKINSSLLVTYTNCPGEEDTAHDAVTWGLHSGTEWARRAMAGRLCCVRMRCPWCPQEDVIGLFG